MKFERIRFNRPCRHILCMGKTVRYRSKLRAFAEKCLRENEISCSSAEKDALIRDMIHMYCFYGFTFQEFLALGFQNRSLKERKEFVADWEHSWFSHKLNRQANDLIFDNKSKTYAVFQPYYQRKTLMCNSEAQREEFAAFAKGLDSFAVKALIGSMGKKFRIVQTSSLNEHSFSDLLRAYPGGFLAEELIVQDPRLAKLHPASVNTCRVPTMRYDDETVVFYPMLRVGQHGSIVDNAGQGGLICSLDPVTGRVIAVADERGRQFETHPDTGEALIGFVVPRWEEALAFVKQLAQVVPDNRSMGWDIALTEKGWVLVEANRRGQFGWQYTLQKGWRAEMNAMLKRAGAGR